jgi:DNA helicase IV
MGVEGMVSAESLAEGFAEEGARLTTAERAAVDRTWTYGHIVVDEAQELTPMQWRLLRRRGPLRSFTVVGDLAQSAALPPAKDWAQALGALTDDFRLELLSVNYRTPQAIAELAETRALRDGLPVTPSRSVREGDAPRIVRAPAAGIVGAVVAAVAEDRQRGDGGSVAVISPAGLVRELHDALRSGLSEPVGYGAQGLGAPVSVLDPWTAKGLEFDSVVVVDPDAVAGDAGPGSLYVALTRPTRRLVVVEPTV